MLRNKLSDLIAWKNSSSRKPLILRGARQVGKTWLMQEFGKTQYTQTVYINFEKNKPLAALFTQDFNINRVIIALQAETGFTIEPGNTLLVFDEIQAAPGAITALKYFNEDAGQYHVIAAGSLLGIMLHQHFSFPVGKVEFMDLYPLTFMEFLEATGDEALATVLAGNDWPLITVFRSKLIDRLKQYYYVGGMPEAVVRFCENKNFKAVREVQRQILDAYENDFSKHAPVEIVPRIRLAWNAIPTQLAKENRKFIYGLIREGSRAKDYELALAWLTDCGLAYKVFRAAKPAFPLKAYEDLSAFKMFMVDVGLMSAMTELDARSLLSGNDLFSEFKGALTEQFVYQQLRSMQEMVTFYWSAERSTAEVDFVVQHQGRIIPLEVKAEENLKAKSLRVLMEKFNPGKAVRLSMSDYREQDWLINLPLYAVNRLPLIYAGGE